MIRRTILVLSRFALLIPVLVAGSGCSRPLSEWTSELDSDEPLTRSLAAAALGRAPRSEEEKVRAVAALFRAYDPRDSYTVPWILRSLDELAPVAAPRAWVALRSTRETTDAARRYTLALTWLTRTRVVADIRKLLPPVDSAADRVRLLLLRWLRSAEPAAAGALLDQVDPLLQDPDNRRAAVTLLAALSDSGLRLRRQLDGMTGDAAALYELLVAVLARQLDSRDITVADLNRCLSGGGPRLEAALLAEARGDDPQLASLCCLGLAAVRAQSESAIALLRRLAGDDQPQEVRVAARFALSQLGR